MVSIFTLLPEYQADKVEPETAPRVFVGAASPLWLMFGGAAAAGAAYWWWASRWREAVNLEALMAPAPEPVASPVESTAVLEATSVVEAVAEVTETVIDAAEEVAVTAAEPLVEAVAAANEDAVEVVVETVAEPIAQAEPAVIEAVEAMAEAPVKIVEAVAETPAKAVEETAPVVEAVAEVVETSIKAMGDDLTRLVGVGPKLAASLADLGVTTFSEIAAWTPEDLASFDELLNLKGRADRDAWIAQAKRFADPVGV